MAESDDFEQLGIDFGEVSFTGMLGIHVAGDGGRQVEELSDFLAELLGAQANCLCVSFIKSGLFFFDHFFSGAGAIF